jgi:hypothetical protein
MCASKTKPTHPHFILIMDGGIVHEILGTHAADITMLDYDCDGAAADEVLKVPRDGYGDRCFHIARCADVEPGQVEGLLTAIERSQPAT